MTNGIKANKIKKISLFHKEIIWVLKDVFQPV